MTATTPAPASASSGCSSRPFVPWTPAVDGAFPLQAAPGFFVQGDIATDTPVHYPPRLGLQPKKTWSDVDLALEKDQTKLVIFLRHGEGLHNADKARVGDAAWESEYQFKADYIDAPLTSTGIDQAVGAREMLNQELTRGGLKLDLVVVSPLERTLYTYEHACHGLPLDAPVVAMEIVRETLGVCPCDERTATAPKRAAFAHIDFRCIVDEDDPWWTLDHRESNDEIDSRAQRFLHQLVHDRSEKRVLVVSHSGFTRACLRVLGHRYYRPANGELVPVLIQPKQKHSDEL